MCVVLDTDRSGSLKYVIRNGLAGPKGRYVFVLFYHVEFEPTSNNWLWQTF